MSDPVEPRHRAQAAYPDAEDLLSSMPPLRRADILALLGSTPPVDGDGFDWFTPTEREAG